MANHDPTMPLAETAVRDQDAVAGCRQDLHPAIDPDHLSVLRQRRGLSLTFEGSIPAAVLFHDKCAPESWNLAPFAQANGSYPGDAHFRLFGVEP